MSRITLVIVLAPQTALARCDFDVQLRYFRGYQTLPDHFRPVLIDPAQEIGRRCPGRLSFDGEVMYLESVELSTASKPGDFVGATISVLARIQEESQSPQYSTVEYVRIPALVRNELYQDPRTAEVEIEKWRVAEYIYISSGSFDASESYPSARIETDSLDGEDFLRKNLLVDLGSDRDFLWPAPYGFIHTLSLSPGTEQQIASELPFDRIEFRVSNVFCFDCYRYSIYRDGHVTRVRTWNAADTLEVRGFLGLEHTGLLSYALEQPGFETMRDSYSRPQAFDMTSYEISVWRHGEDKPTNGVSDRGQFGPVELKILVHLFEHSLESVQWQEK